MSMMTVYFSDPGMPSKSVALESADMFLEVVQREGGNYTDAVCRELKLFAWRGLGEEWVEGRFSSSVQEACRARGFDPQPFDYNMRQLRDLYDYEGMTFEQIADWLREQERAA